MNLRETLREGCFTAHLDSGTKDGIIREMVARLATFEKLEAPELLLDSILARESKMSTGMQHGIAIPHGKTPAVSRLVAAVGIKSDGIDFQSLDGEPSKIFIMTLSPVDDTGPHIQFLAEISKRLNDQNVREDVLKAGTYDEFIEALDKHHDPVPA